MPAKSDQAQSIGLTEIPGRPIIHLDSFLSLADSFSLFSTTRDRVKNQKELLKMRYLRDIDKHDTNGHTRPNNSSNVLCDRNELSLFFAEQSIRYKINLSEHIQSGDLLSLINLLTGQVSSSSTSNFTQNGEIAGELSEIIQSDELNNVLAYVRNYDRYQRYRSKSGVSDSESNRLITCMNESRPRVAGTTQELKILADAIAAVPSIAEKIASSNIRAFLLACVFAVREGPSTSSIFSFQLQYLVRFLERVSMEIILGNVADHINSEGSLSSWIKNIKGSAIDAENNLKFELTRAAKGHFIIELTSVAHDSRELTLKVMRSYENSYIDDPDHKLLERYFAKVNLKRQLDDFESIQHEDLRDEFLHHMIMHKCQVGDISCFNECFDGKANIDKYKTILNSVARSVEESVEMRINLVFKQCTRNQTGGMLNMSRTYVIEAIKNGNYDLACLLFRMTQVSMGNVTQMIQEYCMHNANEECLSQFHLFMLGQLLDMQQAENRVDTFPEDFKNTLQDMITKLGITNGSDDTMKTFADLLAQSEVDIQARCTPLFVLKWAICDNQATHNTELQEDWLEWSGSCIFTAAQKRSAKQMINDLRSNDDVAGAPVDSPGTHPAAPTPGLSSHQAAASVATESQEGFCPKLTDPDRSRASNDLRDYIEMQRNSFKFFFCSARNVCEIKIDAASKLCAILQHEPDFNLVLSLTQDEREALIGESGRFSHRLRDICERYKRYGLVDAIEGAYNASNPGVVRGNSI